MTDETPTLTVYERVHAVLSDLPAIGKDSKAPEAMGGYAFRGIEQITAALKPALAAQGVFMVPTVVQREEMARSTRSGSALYVVDLLIRFTFYGVGGDSFAAEMWGQGSDSGDKAVSKAATSAFKSMLAITFCISDAESDTEKHNVPETTTGPPAEPEIDPNLGRMATRERIALLQGRVKDLGLTEWVKAQKFEWWPGWTEEVCVVIEAKCDETYAAQKPPEPPEPESGGTPDTRQEGAEPVLKGRKRASTPVEPDPKVEQLQATLERTDAHAVDVRLPGDSEII